MLDGKEKSSLTEMAKEAAEVAVLEKYAKEVEEVHEKLMEEEIGEEEFSSFSSEQEPEEDPFGGDSIGDDIESEFDMGGEEIGQVAEPDGFDVPMSFQDSTSNTIEIDVSQLYESNEIVISEDDLLEILKEAYNEEVESLEEQELEEEIEDPTMPDQPEDDESSYGAVRDFSKPESILDEVDINRDLVDDEQDLDSDEESIVYMDYNRTDMAPGHIGGTPTRTEMDKVKDIETIKAKFYELQESFAKITKKQKVLEKTNIYIKECHDTLEQDKKKLIKENKTLKVKSDKVVSQNLEMKNLLKETHLLLEEQLFENKKLTAISRILLDESLNTRQKNVLVESIRKSEDENQIDAYVSSKDVIAESSNKSQPETLTELGKELNKGTTFRILESRSKTDKKESKMFGNSFQERMKRNAGLK